MSLYSLLIGRVGAALLLLSALSFVAGVVRREGLVRSRLRRYVANLDSQLRFLNTEITSAHVVLFQVASGAGAVWAGICGNAPFGLTLLCAVAAPRIVLQIRRGKRVALIEQQLESWLVALANAVRANSSLGESLTSTVQLVRDPIRAEIDLLLKEHQLGAPLDQALMTAAERVGSRTFKTALFAVTVARNSGGNLSDTLSVTAKNLREMARLDGIVRTKTAEGKAQALVMSLVPLPLYLMTECLSPGFFEPLKQTLTGHVICTAAAMSWGIAFVLAQRILDVDI